MTEAQEQRNFLQLSEHGKQAVIRHEQYAKEMYELLNIRHYLIEQIHQKKSITDKNTGRYVPVLGRPDEVYNDVLFLGLDCVDGLNDWSTLYKSDLENVLFSELDKKDRAYDVISVYYKWGAAKSLLLYAKAPIDTQEWTLTSDLYVWSIKDETIITRYIVKLYCFLTEKLDIIEKAGYVSKHNQEWIDRVKPLIAAS